MNNSKRILAALLAGAMVLCAGGKFKQHCG